ncbi:hypothetical protein BS50DRAFT_484282 [Corynespora cassiicola Philippines]|uniref:SH3 domain-containing protein n=1 Tax=Corynespora cassiicola Philippines TaxID=1448308 RepID=A0A2T2P4H3_CORCC|nr:hypothetical protein BS50DRAFT_484282 [Corynespora cassiicola Philippines]
MAPVTPFGGDAVSKAVANLFPLGVDEYFIAFSPSDTQFCGTPGGCSALRVPQQVAEQLLSGEVDRVTWAAFGSDPDSWFFLYEKSGRVFEAQYGQGTPLFLRGLVDQCNPELLSSLRVQFGVSGSFVIWTNETWVSSGIPKVVQMTLRSVSANFQVFGQVCSGNFKMGALENLAWHRNGSFYIKTALTYYFDFCTAALKEAWDELWQTPDHSKRIDQSWTDKTEYIAIDPYSADGDTFVLIKKQRPGEFLVDFILRFPLGGTTSRLKGVASKEMTLTAHRQGPSKVLCWATSKDTGRPHTHELRELKLYKGEKLKVLQERGNNWYIIENQRGYRGWGHGTWLNFQDQVHAQAFNDFKAVCRNIFSKPSTLEVFPNLSKFVNICKESGCQELKQGEAGAGICAHDLAALLRGSGEYDHELVKNHRNHWHPDKFARFCHPAAREGLKEKAGNVFKLFSVLLDAENTSK